MLLYKIYKQHIQLNLQETQVQSLDQEEPLDKKMTTQSSILAWEIPWTKEHGGLQSMGSKMSGTHLPRTGVLSLLVLQNLQASLVGSDSKESIGPVVVK